MNGRVGTWIMQLVVLNGRVGTRIAQLVVLIGRVGTWIAQLVVLNEWKSRNMDFTTDCSE
jgi:hypothetical protein